MKRGSKRPDRLSRAPQLPPNSPQGVSCGAILSDYQRLRVEAVCASLGLTSLSYLWQRNQARSGAGARNAHAQQQPAHDGPFATLIFRTLNTAD